MRLSDLAGKQIVNLYDGKRLGIISEADLEIDAHSGRIRAMLVPSRYPWGGFWGDSQQIVIPWEAIKKIGTEVIIVEISLPSRPWRRQLL